MEITSTLKEISQCKREIGIEVPSEKVSIEFEEIVKRYASRVKIQGFRPGKAPKEMVRRLFLEQIKNDLIENIVPESLNKILKERNLTPINTPVVYDINFEEGEPLQFKASFEVLPIFEVKKYKGIKIEKGKVTVTKEEIEASLETLRQRAAEYIPVENRGIKKGDYVVAQISGRILESKRNLPTERIVILAGHPSNEKILNENLEGMKPNEEKSFVIPYNKDHKNKKLAGKKVEYCFKVLSIKEKKLPEINDNFAKDLGEYENLSDLKNNIKEAIKTNKEKLLQNETAGKILEKIAEKTSFEIPECLVEIEVNQIVKDRFSGVNYNQLNKINFKDLKEKYQKEAEKNVKHYLILRKIAEKEKIEVGEKEIDDEIKAFAERNNLSYETVKRKIDEEGGRKEIKNDILLKKTVDFLLKEAIIKNRVDK
ncbi:MAG: trigger factor [Candidatus Aminicenantia bacterium]